MRKSRRVTRGEGDRGGRTQVRLSSAQTVDEAYAGMLWAQWATAVAYAGLGLALVLLDIDESQIVLVPLREGTVSVEWPTLGALTRGLGAGLVVGFLAIPIVLSYWARRERPALRTMVEGDPAQLPGALNYVGNIGTVTTIGALVAGAITVALFLIDQISNPESALRHLHISSAVAQGPVAAVIVALTMMVFARRRYEGVLQGKASIEVSAMTVPSSWPPWPNTRERGSLRCFWSCGRSCSSCLGWWAGPFEA